VRSSFSLPLQLLLLLLLLPLAIPIRASGQTGDTYHLNADRLEGSLTGQENVYTAIHPVLTHGTTTVTGESALVYREREFVLFRGNVKIVDGTTTMWGDEATYERRQRLATLRGNVRIQEQGSRITGRTAYFYRDKNLSVITGSPRLVDSTRTLTADRIEYDRNTDVVLGLGHVDAVDTAESTRVVAGRVRYDRRSDYAWADQEPRLELTEAGGIVTTVRADSMEFDRAKDRVYAHRNVQVARDSLRATGGQAAFYRAENKAILTQSPKAWDSEGSASGDTLEIRFVQHRVSSIQARPNAKVAYEAKADSGRAERTTASGDTITLFLENDAANRAVIVGSATSFYWPSSADSASGGRNASSGDTIIVEFDKGKPNRAKVLGSGQGTYYLAAEGDTTGAEQRERVIYSGREIDYDLRKSTVDIEGSSNVNYRDMKLRARTIHFDAETEKMRAEGNPVLEDGRDKIVGETMTYDLGIRRGAILEGRTKYEQGYVSGETVMRVTDNILDIKSGTYTTCDEREPHYHFGSSKMRIMLHDKVIARPVVFYMKHIPVIALPFYVFPINSGRHSGFLLPQVQFGSSSAAGKFVRNVGYYFAINDHLDAMGAGDYYQDASWVAHGQFRYHKRYSYNGDFIGSFQKQFADIRGEAPYRWDLAGRHYQTLGRNATLTADLKLTNEGGYLSDPELGRPTSVRIQRNLTSSLGFNKAWSGASFIVGARRFQDLRPDPAGLQLQYVLPEAHFTLSPRPIGRRAKPGLSARLPWLASVVYTVRTDFLGQRDEFEPYVRTTIVRDSLGVPTDTLSVPVDSSSTKAGMLNSVSIADTRTLFGALRLSPSLSANSIYYSEDRAGDLNRVGTAWRAAFGASTVIFGTMARGVGPLRALRHVVTPSVTWSYQPEFRNLTFIDTAGAVRGRFTGVPGISLVAQEQRFMTFALQNDVHVKVGNAGRPRTINNLIGLRTALSWDLLAKKNGRRDLSDLSNVLSIRPIERSQFTFNFVHDPYNGNLKRFDASTGFFLSGTSRAAEDSIQQMSDEPGEAAVREGNYLRSEGLITSNLPWQAGFTIGYTGIRDEAVGSPTFGKLQSTATMNGNVGFNLSRSWRVDYGAQYDMRAREIRSQQFTVKRELHCWEAQFTRSISGDTKEWYFKINVKLLPEVYFEQGSRGLRPFGAVQDVF
jgi:lipopolysaccharide assembly outer membrane protein LptD (OstA)